METFQTESGGLKNNDIAKYGSYRTKDTILEFYDRMAAADAAGIPYETPITPPPGQGPRHPAKKRCVIPRVRNACGRWCSDKACEARVCGPCRIAPHYAPQRSQPGRESRR